ncbi:MAG: hypothetical protein PF630_00680 [Gammaproteobacteria bacterium]|jgi:predicted DNA-binding ribbon-helix-helix protein|nr:hypothetical protein [Gammaproteobacteria bacterium]
MKQSTACEQKSSAVRRNVAINKKLHLSLKTIAAHEDVSLQALVERLIKKGLHSIPAGDFLVHDHSTSGNELPVDSARRST